MEKTLNHADFTALVANLSRYQSNNEELVGVLNSVQELLIKILVVKLKNKTYD